MTVIGSAIPRRMVATASGLATGFQLVDLALIENPLPNFLLATPGAYERQLPDRTRNVGDLLQIEYGPVTANRAGDSQQASGIDQGACSV
jgi:hypothetical protein